MPVTTGSTSSGGQAVVSWGGGPASRAWRFRFEPDDPPGSDGDSRSYSSDPALNRALEQRQPPALALLLDEFTLAWERGQAPAVEEYLDGLDPADCRGAVELIYREFCLAEAAGIRPEPPLYLARFPRHAAALERLLGLHGVCSPSLLGRWVETMPDNQDLPNVGDAIGPYVLRRELGRGGFARVFLAEQSNLEDRLVVVKVTTRPTREPWLLARVRHANIVEIVSHALVDDGALQFQLICMPFWGGATLAAVLAAGRDRARHPVSGSDLLADLDAVAATGYLAVHPARPAREIVAGLSYNQALAWVGARLAEALDHAFSRDVAHGDVKPSNILMSADGNPMLLDFNLARDGSPAAASGLSHDPGGTIAYMAPERLRAWAAGGRAADDPDPGRSMAGPDADTNGHERPDASQGLDLVDFAPHHADIYSLGMVLLEAATGRAPVQAAGQDDPARDSKQSPLEAAASMCAATRGRQSARALIRESEAAQGRAVAPGLRSILERCLDPDPARRYRRAWELAEDLDRWRTNRPMVFTDEPFWGQTVPRFLRRQSRRILLVAAAVSLLIGLPLTTLVLFKSLSNLRETARFKLARHWDDAETQVHRFQRQQAPRLLQPDESHIEVAVRALKDYGVIGSNDWRERDDVRYLPSAEREDLELWLMEQAYLYSRALEDRPDSPDDWRRASRILNAVVGSTPPNAFAAIGRRLGARMGAKESPSSPVSTRPPAATATPWFNEYLLGVVAECEPESEVREASEAADGLKNRQPNQEAVVKADQDPTRRAAARALNHYTNFLALHPDSYWAHYRAASAIYGLGGTAHVARAAGHLEQCLKRRPRNSVLHSQLAACLMELNQNREALQESDKAIEEAPDLAELYRTRAFIRTSLGQTDDLAEDLQHFEILSRLLPRAFSSKTSADPGESSWSRIPLESLFPTSLTFAGRGGNHPAQVDGAGKNVEVDPKEFAVRVDLASRISHAGEYDLAAYEFGKILILDPDQIAARMSRALLSIETRRFEEAQRDLDSVLTNPGLIDRIQKDPTFLQRFQYASRQYCLNGKFPEGRANARRALDLAITLGLPSAESHYILARAYAISARTEPQFIAEAANQLYQAFVANPLNQNNYARDPAFESVRYQIDAVMRKKPDPTEVHRQRRSPALAQAH